MMAKELFANPSMNTDMVESLTLTARWILPVSSAPLERGTIAIHGGRIVAVEPRGQRTADFDLGNTAIIPGLVNAHTHLDLTGLRGKIPPSDDFIGWLRSVIVHRLAPSKEQTLEDIRSGLAESLRFGTTLIGDIAADGASWPVLLASPCRSVVFREMLGLLAQRALPVWNRAIGWLAEHPETESCAAGLSPHAPYSVHHSIIRAVGASGFIQSIHLAETQAELTLLNDRDGPFVGFLNDLGVWDDNGLAPSIDWILWRMSRAPSVLLVHGNYLSPDAPIPPNATIVYCPRTHAAFGHPPHPFREFLMRGIRVALGTDSLASNPDLDILAEARFIHERYPDFPGERLLRMATLSGAEALGWERECGSLEAGKSADLVIVPLATEEFDDPYEALFQDDPHEKMPRRMMWRGVWR